MARKRKAHKAKGIMAHLEGHKKVRKASRKGSHKRTRKSAKR